MTGHYGARTPTQTAWLASAAVLLAVLVTGGAWLVWQGLGHARAPDIASSATPLSELPDDVAFGAPELIDGVPWGFPLTASGAAAAASTAVAVTGQADTVFDPDRFARVADVVFTPELAAMQARQVETARAEFDLSGWASQPASRRLYWFSPLSVRLTTFDPSEPAAKVEVWSMTLVGVGDSGGSVFTTSTVTLIESDGTWIVEELETVEGPTPLVQDTASAPGRTRALLRDATATWPLPLPEGAGS